MRVFRLLTLFFWALVSSSFLLAQSSTQSIDIAGIKIGDTQKAALAAAAKLFAGYRPNVPEKVEYTDPDTKAPMGFWWEGSSNKSGFYEIVIVGYSSRQVVDFVTRSHSYVFDDKNRPSVQNFRSAILEKYGKPTYILEDNRFGSTAIWFFDAEMHPYTSPVQKVCMAEPLQEWLTNSLVDAQMHGLPRVARPQCPASLRLSYTVSEHDSTLVYRYKMTLFNEPAYWQDILAEKAKLQQQREAERRAGEKKRPDL